MNEKHLNQFRLGVGLRSKHYPYLEQRPPVLVDWFEAISENYMASEGRPLEMLLKVRESYPVALHGVSLSIGSVDPVSSTYLKQLKRLIDRVAPEIVSDHMCWTGVAHSNAHDLLPVPFTLEALNHISAKVQSVQDFLGRQICLENVSSYIQYSFSEMSEWEFLAGVAERSGCGLLLDVNNVYVSSQNHGFDPVKFINAIPKSAVKQFHVAGFTDMGDFLFDTHSKPVHQEVWELYERAVKRWPDVPVLLEWDDEIPEFKDLEAEALKAKALWEKVNGKEWNEPRNNSEATL